MDEWVIVLVSLASNQSFNEGRLAGAKGSFSKRGLFGAIVRITLLLGEVPDRFDAVSVILWSPTAVVCPVMAPVTGLMDRPVGSPLAEKPLGCSVPRPDSVPRKWLRRRGKRFPNR